MCSASALLQIRQVEEVIIQHARRELPNLNSLSSIDLIGEGLGDELCHAIVRDPNEADEHIPEDSQAARSHAWQLGGDYAAVRAAASPGDLRRLRDMRRRSVMEPSGGGDARDVSEPFGNSIARSSFLFKTLQPGRHRKVAPDWRSEPRWMSPKEQRLKLFRILAPKTINGLRIVIAKSLITLERVKGIEPSYSAWKAAALPLSYTRDFNSLSCFSTYRWHVSGTEIRAVLTESA
jgi:hypothetical protein